MRGQGILFLVLGLILASLGGFLSWNAIQQAGRQTAPGQVATRPVVVAKANIAERVQINAADVTVKAFPADLAPSGALTNIQQAEGKITLAPIQEGEAILPHRIAQDSKGGLAPSFLVPTPASGQSWQTIVAIPASDYLAQGGLLRAGDRVDIISTMTVQDGQRSIRTTQTILQNIPVLGVGPGGGLSKDVTGGNPVVTLLVTHQDAVALNHVLDAGGTFHLLLRAPLDTGDANTQQVTPDYLAKRFRLLP